MQMEVGPQPLDQLMIEAGINNHDLVVSSADRLTHKQISKARKGRKITLRMQNKVLTAWNTLFERKKVLDELFNYRGR